MMIANNPYVLDGLSQHLQQVIDGLKELTPIEAPYDQLEDIRHRLRQFEDESPVSIIEFIDSDKYLDMRDYLFPAGKWLADTFYNPQDHFDECAYLFRDNSGTTKEYTFPGFSQLGYTKEELALFHFNELVIIIGQRAIKSVISAIIALYEYYKLIIMPDPSTIFPGLGRNSPIHIAVGATAASQADIGVFAYVENWFQQSPWFRRYRERCQQVGLRMPDGREVFHQTNATIAFEHKFAYLDRVHAKAGSLRGATRKAIVNDEISHFDDGDKRSADSVYSAMVNSTKTFQEQGVIVNISSPLHVTDKGMRLLANCGVKFRSSYYDQFGFTYLDEYNGSAIEPVMSMLGFHYPTWEINPTSSFESFENDRKKDPEAFLRDFGALPSQAEQAFFSDTSAISVMFDKTMPCPINELGQFSDSFRPKGNITNYHLHVDAGAGKPSNFAFVLGHSEPKYDPITGERKNMVIIDLAYAVMARVDGEVDLIKARELLDIIIGRFPIDIYSSDRWNDIEYMQKIKNKVRTVERVVVDIEHYNALKILIHEGHIKCHTSDLGASCRVSPEEELKRLGLRNGNKVEKGVGYFKDISDGIASVSFRCMNRAAKRLVSGRITAGLMSRH